MRTGSATFSLCPVTHAVFCHPVLSPASVRQISPLMNQRRIPLIASRPLVFLSRPVRALAVSRDGRWVYSGSDDLTVRVWRATDGACTSVYRGHEMAVWSLALPRTGEVLFSGEYSRRCHVPPLRGSQTIGR